MRRLTEVAVLCLIAYTILWRGGKSLESTWLLTGVSCVGILSFLFNEWKIGSEEKTKYQELWIIVILFIAWTGLSYLLSTTQNYGLDEVLRTGSLGLLMLWILTERNADFERRLLQMITLAALISCIVGSLVYISQPVNRFVGTFFDSRFHTDYWPNACANFLLLTWPIALATTSSWKVHIKKLRLPRLLQEKMVQLLTIGIILGSLLLTFSRGALIAFVGQIALLMLLLLVQSKNISTVRSALTKMAVALFVGFVVFIGINEARGAFHPVQSVSEKITFTAAEGNSSINERQSFWNHAIQLTVLRPIFGWGPYSFRFVHTSYQTTPLATSDHPHNVFLKLSSERGIVAALLFAAIVAIALYAGLMLTQSGKRLYPDDKARLGFPLLTVSIAGVIAHSLIDYNLQFVGVALPLWLVMGILVRRSIEHKKQLQLGKKVTKKMSSLSFPFLNTRNIHIVTASVALLLLFAALREGHYLYTSSKGRHAEAAGDTEEALKWYSESEPEWFTRDMRLSQAQLSIASGNLDQAHENILTYIKQNAHDARAWELLGSIENQRGEFLAAIDAYEKAFELAGWNNLGISNGLLQTLFAETFLQPTSDAAADAKRLPLHPKIKEYAPIIEERVIAFADAIDQNLHFVALSPNPEAAINILITLSVLYPEKSEEYQSMITRIETKAEKERSKMKARKPGWLW